MRIQHNIMAMNAYRNYTNNTSALSKNLEKLSSGYKINRAGDDAAGLAISEKMRAQITGLDKAQDNAKDGISLVQTAEGALTEVHDMLNRMVELATQSANGTYENTVDRKNLQDEMDQLKSEINRIADSANFNGIKLLDGSLGAGANATGTIGTTSVSLMIGSTSATVGGAQMSVTFADGSSADAGIQVSATGSDVTITLGTKTAETYTAAEITQAVRDYGKQYAAENSTDANKKAVGDMLTTFTMKADGPMSGAAGASITLAKTSLQDGNQDAAAGLELQIGDTSDSYNQLTVSVQDMHVVSLGLADVKISDQASAQEAVSVIKDAINTVSSVRGSLGAIQNRLDHTINNLSVMEENIQDAESSIRDTDVAGEMMAYTKNNILVQSAQAMLAQANQVPQGVLQLLQ